MDRCYMCCCCTCSHTLGQSKAVALKLSQLLMVPSSMHILDPLRSAVPVPCSRVMCTVSRHHPPLHSTKSRKNTIDLTRKEHLSHTLLHDCEQASFYLAIPTCSHKSAFCPGILVTPPGSMIHVRPSNMTIL